MSSHPIKCSILYNDLIFDLGENNVKWCCNQKHGNKISAYTPSDYHNDPILKDIRTSLANGIKHDACSICWKAEDTGLKSWRQIYGRYDVTSNAELLQKQVTRLEIKFDRTCDLACIYCGPWNSTSWEKENNKSSFYQWSTNGKDHVGFRKILETVTEIGRFNRELMIEYTGGEPLLSKHFTKENLEELINCYQRFNEPSSNLVIKITTNANTPKKKLIEVINWLGSLKSQNANMVIQIAISLESIGRFTEFSRYLSDWETIDRNIKMWLSQEWIEPMISASFNSLTLPNLPDFIRYISDVFSKKDRLIMISPNVVYNPIGLSTTVLPKSFSRYLDESLDLLLSNRQYFDQKTDQGYDSFKAAIVNMIETLGNTIHNKPELKRFTDYCIDGRKINLREINPDLYRYVYVD